MKHAGPALAVVVAACIPPLPPFDCGRPDALCGGEAVCIDSRCADPAPTSECASGFRYQDNAGELALQCVLVPDAGVAPLDATDGAPALVFHTGQAADLVLGQPDFVSSRADTLPVETSLIDPSGLCAAGDRLFISDSGHNRVLEFGVVASSGQTAERAVGQRSLDDTNAGSGADHLNGPRGIACDAGHLAVADGGNHRVLLWSPLPTVAGAAPSLALGQVSLEASMSGGGGAGLSAPGAASMVGDGLAVADTANHRVLVWAALPATSGAAADWVVGQPDWSGNAPDHGGTAAADSLDGPAGLLAIEGYLWVADRNNHRLLGFAGPPFATGAPATAVHGQVDFVSTSANRGIAPAANTLSNPEALCSDGMRTAVVDSGNHRVLVFASWPTVGIPIVLGQPAVDRGDPVPATASSLRSPRACTFVAGALFVADSGNNRVVRFSPAP